MAGQKAIPDHLLRARCNPCLCLYLLIPLSDTMPVEILDLHSLSNEGIPNFDMSKEIVDGLSRPEGQKNLPTMLLYDERGLRLYDDITTAAPEYYLFGAEEEILKDHADEIVAAMHHNAKPGEGNSTQEVVLELGAGCVLSPSHPVNRVQ